MEFNSKALNYIRLSALEGELLFLSRFIFGAYKNPGSLAIIRAKVEIVSAAELLDLQANDL